MSELKLNQVDVTKLNLQPGETLVVTIKRDDILAEDLTGLRKMFNRIFPNNQTLVLALGTNDDIKFTSALAETAPVSSCSTGNFCNDCSCGKKEDFERSQNRGE